MRQPTPRYATALKKQREIVEKKDVTIVVNSAKFVYVSQCAAAPAHSIM